MYTALALLAVNFLVFAAWIQLLAPTPFPVPTWVEWVLDQLPPSVLVWVARFVDRLTASTSDLRPHRPSDIRSLDWPIIVSVEGNIGSGKSTLLRRLKEDHTDFLQEQGIVLVQEPVDVWMNYLDPEDGESILKKFYDHPDRYAFLFQLVIHDSIMDAIDHAIVANPDARVLLCERSVSSSHEVFMKMFRDDGEVNALEYKYYRTITDNPNLEDYRPSHLFYLDTPVEVCMERIEVRGRENESNITEHYLDKCEFYTEHWFKQVVQHQGEPGVPQFHRLDDNDPTTFIQTWHEVMSTPSVPPNPYR